MIPTTSNSPHQTRCILKQKWRFSIMYISRTQCTFVNILSTFVIFIFKITPKKLWKKKWILGWKWISNQRSVLTGIRYLWFWSSSNKTMTPWNLYTVILIYTYSLYIQVKFCFGTKLQAEIFNGDQIN